LLVALKVLALALLWWLFFSSSHRIAVDAHATNERLGVAHAGAGPGASGTQADAAAAAAAARPRCAAPEVCR
jgi:hypothetical protein